LSQSRNHFLTPHAAAVEKKSILNMRLTAVTAKPFLKWAGGKKQLLSQLSAHFPAELKTGELKRYAEPFLGGGAMFFHLVQFYELREFWLSDINEEIVLCYQTIKHSVKDLIDVLDDMQSRYWQSSPQDQEKMFYEMRGQFNINRSRIDFTNFSSAWIERTAQTIFLNRTCFNGLFRVNSSGFFNVPFGKYSNPALFEKNNLLEISEILQDARISCSDFTTCSDFVDSKTFCYLDPPYRPISQTASFTSYSMFDFKDDSQARLASFFRALDAKEAKLMLSNSNPKNENPDDDFFQLLYQGFNISTVLASRAINSNGNKRGAISELVITNY
jgi:DNA adenine methylase